MFEPSFGPSLAGTSPGTVWDADLVSRLANQLFASPPGLPYGLPSEHDAPVSVPTSIAGVPTESAADPADLLGKSAAPASRDSSRDIALAGGFPNAGSPSGPPPVHPTVVSGEPTGKSQIKDPPEGTHVPGSSDSHEFGEPSFRVWERRSTERTPSVFDTPTQPDAATDFYFIKGLTGSNVAPPFSLVHPTSAPSFGRFDIDAVRRDFPALHQRVNGRPLIWLDNAATTHKPQSVLDATSSFYGRDNSNIHRAAHTLAARSTELFEAGREKVRQFLGAGDAKEIVFVRGTTEAINLVAQSYGKQNVGAGDEIIVSQLEHHANIVPWQLLAQQTGAVIRVIPINDKGELILEELPKLFTARTKLVSVTHVSNALGTINPVEQIIALSHAYGVPVLVDGAQSTPHIPINVQALDADFYVFSGHKIFGPTGIGALYGKAHLLDSMPPWQGGGHMIQDVTFERTVYNEAPEKFEAGTPDIAGVVGLGAAIDYLMGIGIPAIAAYEHSLLEYATEALHGVRGIRPIGTASNKASVLGFVIPGVENSRVAKYLDQLGIAVRAGHHCAMPAVRHFGVEGTIRPSLAFYNTIGEVDELVRALHAFTRQ